MAAELRQHVDSCGECSEETQDIEELWARLGDIPADPVPTKTWMRARFDRMLDAYRAGREEDAPPSGAASEAASIVPPSWRWSPVVQAGVAAALLLLGLGIGRLIHPTASAPASDLTDVRQELHDLREMLTLSLMQQQSATERLRGVSWSNHIDQPGSEIISALLDALTHDPNVNVRLASVDALRRFSDRDIVRTGTVQTLTETSFPMLQVALIDFLVETKETSAMNALRRLSEDPSVNESVRSRAAWGVQRLGS